MPLQMLTTRATPKATKQAARYTPAGGAERCGMCRHYVPSSSCARIEGPISAAGWCHLYSQQVTWRPRAGQDAGLNTGGGPPGATLDLSFMTPGSLDGRITFTRASTGTYFDATGTLRTAAINTPRWDCDPVNHTLNGLLLEDARTNLLLNSATLGTQSVAVTAQSYLLSFYGTGTITRSGTSSGSLVGTGATQRVFVFFTPTAGTLTLTVAGTVTNAQLEAAPPGTPVLPSSYIPTTAAAVTRAADAAAMTGANFSSWFTSNAAGSFAAQVYYNLIPTAAASAGRIIELSDGTTANFLTVLPQFLSNQYQLASTIASVAGTALNAASGATAPGSIANVSMAYGGGSRFFCANAGGGAGPSPVISTAGGIASVNQLGIGNRADLARGLDGCMRRVRYWPRALSAAELQSVTT
jgi:hypothetical protein